MKKKLLKILLLSTIIIILVAIYYQIIQNKIKQKNVINWFNVKQIAEKTWLIDDHGADNFYLVEGKNYALLIDNGLGVADVRNLVISLTKLPIITVNTHGHIDHVGANYQFPVVYGHALDFKQIENENTPEQRKLMSEIMYKGVPVPNNILFKYKNETKTTITKPIEEGYIFNLGERQLEVIHVPGHTPGSICLLDRQNKLLFTGDNNNTFAWLFLKNSEPLETYLQSLNKLNKIKAEFEIILPGHGDPLDKTFIDEEITCVKNILGGNCQPEPYKSPIGDMKLCTYKRSSIAYNPDNIHKK